MPKTKTYYRQWRRNQKEHKRFAKVATDFLKTKHPAMFEEICVFYRSLEDQNPGVNDLTKTLDYKRWKKQQKQSEEEKTFSQPEPDQTANESEKTFSQPEPDQTGNESEKTVSEPESDQADNEAEQVQVINEGDQDILSLAAQELFSDGEVNNDIQNVQNAINEIIAELEHDNTIREYLNAVENNDLVVAQYEEFDEGIGLNIEDELQVEPFDFSEEVEPFDY